MVRRRAKKCVKRTEEERGEIQSDNDAGGARREDKAADYDDREVDKQTAAIRAIRDMEVGHALTALRLLRSNFTEEQLQTPTLQFFKENLPNLSLVQNEETGDMEVKWKDEDGDSFMDDADERDIHLAYLQRLSMGFPNLYSRSSFGGYGLTDTGTSLLGVNNPHLNDLVFQAPSDGQMLGTHDALRTPGVSSQRLSIGMTPKSRRLPKPGEMLLSVHGSPLGVFKEDKNMGAINEEDI